MTSQTPQTHILGYPRIGEKRQSKFTLERYWAGKQNKQLTLQTLQQVFDNNIEAQLEAGLSIVTTGDFAHYDMMLTQAIAFGVQPDRFKNAQTLDTFDRQFYFARGRDHTGSLPDTPAWQMTKWFDTNYHYLVPEICADETFVHADFTQILKQVTDTQAILSKHQQQHVPIKVVLIGPVSFLYLLSSNADDKLSHLATLLPVYAELLNQLGQLGVAWVQMDEPILALDLSARWQQAFERAYHGLQQTPPQIIVASYFDTLNNNCHVACNLPVNGLHVDLTRATRPKQYLTQVIDHLPVHKILSVGVVDGRSVWTTDQACAQDLLAIAYERLQERLWVGSGSSLLHLPVDLTQEHLPQALKGKLAFAKQKLDEVVICGQLATGTRLPDSTKADIKLSLHHVEAQSRQGCFSDRYKKQLEQLKLPLLPTTTIGSFPQTKAIRKARHEWQTDELSDAEYKIVMQAEIKRSVEEQENLGIDVLVHGEAERTDMVEYFAQYLEGFWLSKQGWVQSYGTRCVRPPIVIGDIQRLHAMTVEWTQYAQSLTKKPIKGMLTGPVTILNWSFAPSDTSTRDVLRMQLAEAIRQEVDDLQTAGIHIIQIDEPAFREGLPLQADSQTKYWQEAVKAFRHASSCANINTQIHTHMCYSSFHDCIEHIAAMDADVITIETARSGLQLLDAFEHAKYDNAIGPGVYDIHSPRTPSVQSMQTVIDEALKYIPVERLWINPDCGLKTRNWQETRDALHNMVMLAIQLRQRYQSKCTQ